MTHVTGLACSETWSKMIKYYVVQHRIMFVAISIIYINISQLSVFSAL